MVIHSLNPNQADFFNSLNWGGGGEISAVECQNISKFGTYVE